MRVKHLAAGLALCAALALAGPAMAGDTVRLNLPGNVDAPTLDLKARPADLDLKADPTWGWRGGWRGGWGGGWRGGWGGGYWGGYRGGYYGGYWGGYRGFYGGGFAPRFYGGYYAPRFYSYGFPTYSYYGGFYPCSLDIDVTVNKAAVPTMPRIIESPPITAPNGNAPARPAPGGTFDYDGGPKSPVPMPKANETDAARFPSKPAIVSGELFVGMPAAALKSGKWVYPAYGEAPRRDR